MPQPSKSFWRFFQLSVAESRPFLSLVVGAAALIPVFVCWLVPSPSAGTTVLRLLACWSAPGSVLFGLVVLLVWEYYCESQRSLSARHAAPAQPPGPQAFRLVIICTRIPGFFTPLPAGSGAKIRGIKGEVVRLPEN